MKNEAKQTNSLNKRKGKINLYTINLYMVQKSSIVSWVKRYFLAFNIVMSQINQKWN